MEILALKDLIFAKGKEAGFTDMEISYISSQKFSCNVYEGEIDDFALSVDGGVSFRGLYQKKMGYAYTERLDETSVEMLVQTALENAKVIDSGEEEIIFEGSPVYEELELYSEGLNVPTEEKIAFLKELEKAALQPEQGVKKVVRCLYADITGEHLLYNTKGLNKQEKSNLGYYYLSIAVADQDSVKNGYVIKTTDDFRRLRPQEIAAKLIEETRATLGAAPVKSKAYPVVLKNKAAAELLEAYSGIFSAENVQKGRSRLKNKLGEAIAGQQVTLLDDPLRKGGVASRSFDSEGVASRRITLVEEGVLKSFLHNLQTAKKDGVEPTGHGYKSSYKSTVSIAPSNLYIEPGENSYEDMVASLEEGLVITELQGLHSGVSAISGDFSLAASGFYVAGGTLSRPVNQITIAGNFFDLLQEIDMIGSDLEFGIPSHAHVGAPSLKIRSLAVAGI